LPEPSAEPQATRSRAAWTVVETELLAEWCELLGISDAGLDETFFDLGGNSLAAVQLVLRIQERFGVNLPLQALLGAPTVAALAAQIERYRDRAGDTASPSIEAAADAFAAAVVSTSAEPIVPPRTETERRLKAIWERLLGTTSIGVTDNFFDLGGSPGQLGELLSEVRVSFGVFAEGLPLNPMVAALTIEALAKAIEEGSNSSSSVVCLQPRGTRRPMFAIHAGGGYVFFYRALAAHLAPERPMYGLQATVDPDPTHPPFYPSSTIEELAARYVAEVKRVQPTGPYLLSGACFGGVIAFEMARQLRAGGDEVDSLILFNAFVMNNRRIEDGATPLRVRGGEIIFGSVGWRTHLARLAALEPRESLRYLSTKLGVHIRSEVRRLTQLPTRFRDRIAEQLEELTYRYGRLFGRAVSPDFVYRRATLRSLRLLGRYTPGKFDGRIVLFRAVEDHDAKPLWMGLGGGLEVHDMPGGHLDMLEEPIVQNTARLVREHLDAADRRAGNRSTKLPLSTSADSGQSACTEAGVVFGR
jgi:aspartate racemase